MPPNRLLNKMKYARFLFYAGLVAAQPFNFGVKGGVGLTDDLAGTMARRNPSGTLSAPCLQQGWL
jgi:hypothetical protein